jgi:hypothetical protein
VDRAGLDFLGILCRAAILLLRALPKLQELHALFTHSSFFSNHVMVALLFHDGSALVLGL